MLKYQKAKYQRVIKRAYFPVISELIKKEIPFDLNMIYPPKERCFQKIIYPLPSELTLIHWIGLMIYSFVLIQFVSYAGPNVRGIVSQVNLPKDRGTLFGLFNILDNVGKATGPLFGGFLIETLRSVGYSDALAYEYTLLIRALFWIPYAAVWLWIRKSYPEDRDMVKEILKKRAIELSKTF